MRTLSACLCSTTVAVTSAPDTVGLPTVVAAPSLTRSTSPSVTVAPASAGRVSTTITSSLATLYCFPPVRMTAYMGDVASLGSGPMGAQTRTDGPNPVRGGRHYSQDTPQVNAFGSQWLAGPERLRGPRTLG